MNIPEVLPVTELHRDPEFKARLIKQLIKSGVAPEEIRQLEIQTHMTDVAGVGLVISSSPLTEHQIALLKPLDIEAQPTLEKNSTKKEKE